MSKHRHILIVDEDLIGTVALKHTLEKAGIQATVLREGSKAIDVLHKTTFDLVLLDIRLQLSDVDGWSVLLHMKSDTTLSSIPVFVLSNAGLQHEIERGLELGADAYLLKAHVSVKEVVSKIRDFLGDSASSSATVDSIG